MWLFWHKLKFNGDLERHKAHVDYDDLSQEIGIDCDETFSLFKLLTIRVVLILAMVRKWSIHQLDVKNSSLHGNMKH